jgi:alkanesulfonate monooxygenase SsuD/methylene tetrahydromethanopterin reductase-like flavin-dependent oxidoreductase (luciferase family)
MVDRAKAMQAIWTQDAASYHGEFTQFDAIWSWPKPVQKPHPPILLGGETKYSLRRIVEFCDGWIPRGRAFTDPQAEMARLKQFADEAGREMSTLSVSLFGTRPDAKYIDECRAAGVDRALFTLPSEGKDMVLPLVDQFAQFISE